MKQDIGKFIVYADIANYPLRSFVHSGSRLDGIRKMQAQLRADSIFDADVWVVPVAANFVAEPA